MKNTIKPYQTFLKDMEDMNKYCKMTHKYKTILTKFFPNIFFTEMYTLTLKFMVGKGTL